MLAKYPMRLPILNRTMASRPPGSTSSIHLHEGGEHEPRILDVKFIDRLELGGDRSKSEFRK